MRNIFVDVDSYQDEALKFNADFMFEEISASYEILLEAINKLSEIRKHIADAQQIKTNNRFSSLINSIIFISKFIKHFRVFNISFNLIRCSSAWYDRTYGWMEKWKL